MKILNQIIVHRSRLENTVQKHNLTFLSFHSYNQRESK